METLLRSLAIIHVFAGVLSLVTGAIAIFTEKGRANHKKSGKLYSIGMLVVFITAVALSAYKFIPFLFMLAFLSYYSVFAGVRILKLKQLHKEQRPRWYDWFAGIVTAIAGLSFIGYGAYYLIQGNFHPIAFLSVFFGVITISGAYSNMKPFWKKPEHSSFWWFYHLNAMAGSYIAASTAFGVTLSRMLSINSPLVWVVPTFIGVFLMRRVHKKYERQFGLRKA